MTPERTLGTIKHLSRWPKVFGIIIGDDLREYFFIPSFLDTPVLFTSLEIGTPVEFLPYWTGSKWRANLVTVPSRIQKTEPPGGEDTRIEHDRQ